MFKMQPVLDSKEIRTMLAALKQRAGVLITNFYLGEIKIRELISQRALYFVLEQNGILVLKSHDDYFNLYFVASSIGIVKRMVSGVAVDKTLVLDLISREQDSQQWREAFSDFTDYAIFQRMCKLPAQNGKTGSMEQDVIVASLGDAQAIYEMTVTQFDRLSEHLPSIEEIRDAIKKQNILVIKKQNVLAAFLFFENVGLTSTLRYWFVDRAFRGQHLGAKLMQSYFACSQETKRYILWVNRSNTQTIMKYQYYGYQPDGTVDTILLKRCGNG